MNILFLSTIPRWSGGKQAGGAPSFSRTVKAYQEQGNQIYLLTTEPDSLPYQEENLQVSVVTKKIGAWFKGSDLGKNADLLRIFWLSFIFPLAALTKAIKLSRQVSFDLIYGYEIHGILAGYLVKKFLGKPLVSRFQGTILYPFLDRKSSLFQRLLRFYHYWGFKVPADLAIMTDDGTFGDVVLENLNPELAAKSYFWRNGVDLKPDKSEHRNVRTDLKIDKDTIVLMTVSRLEAWKRVDRAIHALPKIVGYTEKVILIIVGEGSEQQQLDALSQELGVDLYIIFAGLVPHSQVRDYLQSADIFLSLYDLSNIGNPLLEAMSYGKPIVTINNGDTASIIEDQDTGILLESGSEDEVSGAVIDLIADPANRSRIGANAARFAQDNFWSWDERLNAELKTVAELVSSLKDN